MSHTAPEGENRHTNRLVDETSPYLLQHAHNPVDWYPWGEEAFERARAEDKPVFLSVGYSACHWCHVMERESFEDEAIAAVMNEHYVNIKVDREERPDVDQIYMSAVQLMTQRGGWPMSVFMTPDGRPFYGGTYWPPTSRMGMPGFRDILLKLHEYWTEHRDEVTESADKLSQAVSESAAPRFQQSELNENTIRFAARMLLKTADRQHGGFGGAPKFPHPMDVRVLLRCWKRLGDDDALAVARLTLDKMASGGIYDHLGGGFHRYSTDAHWLVPHFEKMLYDNALLVPAYVEAFQCTEDCGYLRVVKETLEYVLREMTQPDGGFYSTQDADSEGEEGKFFVWSEDEVVELLGTEDARVFNYCYDVTPRGNWEGKTILNRPKTDEQAAKMLGVAVENLKETLARCRAKLFDARSQRIPPGRDDKVLVSWNGMMIAAIAKAARGRSSDEAEGVWRDSIAAAEKAAGFIVSHVTGDDGRLLHTWKDDRAAIGAFLDDYACLIDGLVELYQTTFDARWLTEAVRLAEQMIEQFADREGGGFFYTAADQEQLIARSKDAQDGATPSGNGMAATALLKLGRLTGRTDLEEAGYQTLQSLSGLVNEHPRAASQALIALDFHLGPTKELVLVEGEDPAETERAARQIAERFVPNLLLVRHAGGDVPEVLGALLEGKESEGGELTGYVCERGACGLPVRGVEGVLGAVG
ncbi:MAG: thioredoxin domain-containing protein [Planctomycetota bacterium]|nr:MAG: thioredoxin domain-containing protein [Planctomycetota bacterium]REK20237.1 MAG: thioredoxin domain-containing protein [Planctomycetota bacterium]REK35365.1 MAG: thioredoxin domain-containing protein [Planctomycetota bacterium]